MRFISFEHRDGPTWGILDGAYAVDLGTNSPYPTLRDALMRGGLDRLPGTSGAPRFRTGDVRMLPPICWPEKILCVELNYRDHGEEKGHEKARYPVVLPRFADTLVADGEPLVAPWRSSTLDYEGELAVVIGRRGRHVDVSDALDLVFGYSVFNDASVREYQWHTHQYTPGKNFPGTGAFSPAIVTPDEVGDLDHLRITTRLNGAPVQESRLGNIIFSVAELIAYCSEWTELRPGDVIATGTPGGGGASHQPPLWLHPGDICQVAIEGIGTLTNSVIAEQDAKDVELYKVGSSGSR